MTRGLFIVLAAYNGEQYIAQQIESIRAQSITDWRLLVRDDGSHDDTRKIIESYCAEDDRIELLPSGPTLATAGNFSLLLQTAHEAGAEYVFPSDQDDVWRPDKIQLMMENIAQLEAVHGCSAPLLVHSDLEVVDETLATISLSFLKYRRLRHQAAPLGVLLVHNFVTGCASLYNRALLETAIPVPRDCIMHDWWFALVAAATGQIGFVADALVRYRQHRDNQIGAQPRSDTWLSNLLRRRELWALGEKNMIDAIRQAACLNKHLATTQRSNQHRAAIAAYASILEQPPMVRAARLIQYAILPQRLHARHCFFFQMILLSDKGLVRSAENHE